MIIEKIYNRKIKSQRDDIYFTPSGLKIVGKIFSIIMTPLWG